MIGKQWKDRALIILYKSYRLIHLLPDNQTLEMCGTRKLQIHLNQDKSAKGKFLSILELFVDRKASRIYGKFFKIKISFIFRTTYSQDCYC